MRVALVTGAGQGIGFAIARALARVGMAVAVNDIDPARAASAAESVNGLSVACDVSNASAVEAMVSTVGGQLGPVSVLVNNAGICGRGGITDVTEEQWDRVLAVNLKGTFFCSRAVLPGMRAQGWGRIVNMASIAGKMGGLMVNLAYSASKGGILAFTKGLAREVAKDGITVNAVCPALTDTDMAGIFGSDERQRYITSVPLGRLAKADEVAAAVVFLASDAASYITGEVLDVNGGVLMD
jgi:NAD(P)-dependent dehydrogenase (short-subunit alcohol dehydrogenase family)